MLERGSMRRLSSTLALSWLGLVVLVSTHALAAEGSRPLRAAIDVDPGATCLDAATLVQHIQGWLGADTVDADVSVEVRGSPDDARTVGFRTLRAGSVIASRRFEPGPERCEHLHAALGLAIAMAIKASLFDELAGAAANAGRESVKKRTSETSSPAQAWAIGMDPLAAVQVLPAPAFGLDLRVERTFTRTWSARLGLVGLAALSKALDGGTFDTWLVAPRVDVCAGFELSDGVSARGCMGAMAGGLYAQGHGYAESRGTLVRWAAAANGLDLAVDLGSNWSLDLAASLILPVVSTSIVLKNMPANNAPAQVVSSSSLAVGAPGGAFGVGPVYRF